MQHGSLAMVSRKEAPAVWQFRWSEKDLHGIRVQRKRVIGSVERYPDEAAARSAVCRRRPGELLDSGIGPTATDLMGRSINDWENRFDGACRRDNNQRCTCIPGH